MYRMVHVNWEFSSFSGMEKLVRDFFFWGGVIYESSLLKSFLLFLILLCVKILASSVLSVFDQSFGLFLSKTGLKIWYHSMRLWYQVVLVLLGFA